MVSTRPHLLVGRTLHFYEAPEPLTQRANFRDARASWSWVQPIPGMTQTSSLVLIPMNQTGSLIFWAQKSDSPLKDVHGEERTSDRRR